MVNAILIGQQERPLHMEMFGILVTVIDTLIYVCDKIV